MSVGLSLVDGLLDKIETLVDCDYSDYKHKPVEFVKEVLRVKVVTPQQIKVLTSIDTKKYTAVPSGHGVGKSYLAAWAAIWFLYTRKPSKVITSAPTAHQVEAIIWKYIRQFVKGATLDGELLNTKLVLGQENGEETWFAEGFTKKEAVSFQGYHSPNMLVIFDEAVGIAPDHWDSAGSLIIGDGDRMLAIGNPTISDCQFKTEIDSGKWNVIPLSCLDHPNVISGRTIIEGAVTRGWVEEKKEDYGEDSDLYKSRVLGEFPESSSTQLISDIWIKRCTRKADLAYYTTILPAVVAIDPAGGSGDETAIAKVFRDGYIIMEYHYGWDEMDSANYMSTCEADLLVVDDIGLGGGVCSRLDELGVAHIKYNSNNASPKPSFMNFRAYAHYQTAKAFKDKKVSIIEDKELRRQLLALKMIEDETKGKLKMEEKRHLSKRLGRSPDRSDALIMAWIYFELQYEMAFMSSSDETTTNAYSQGSPFEHQMDMIDMFDRIETIMP